MSLSDIFGKKVKSLNDVETVGDLKKLIKYAQSAKRAEAGKEAAEEWAKASLWDETFGKIPGLSTAKNATDMLKAMYDQPDEARTGTALDHLDVDDDIAKIVDDPIENAFLKQYTEDLEDEDDDIPLSDVNVTKELSKFIKNKFNDRTVIGFNEGKNTMRITESKLRRVLQKIILEFGETDAEVIRQSQNREKMIGRGINMGKIGFDPNWDYATNRPLKPKKMHRLEPELQLVADMIIDEFEELQLMPGRNGGPPDMFYFTMVGSGIRARCDYKSYSVQKYHSDFTGDGCFISTQNPDAVKGAFEKGAETSGAGDIQKLLEDFIDFAQNNIQEDSVWMTFAPAS